MIQKSLLWYQGTLSWKERNCLPFEALPAHKPNRLQQPVVQYHVQTDPFCLEYIPGPTAPLDDEPSHVLCLSNNHEHCTYDSLDGSPHDNPNSTNVHESSLFSYPLAESQFVLEGSPEDVIKPLNIPQKKRNGWDSTQKNSQHDSSHYDSHTSYLSNGHKGSKWHISLSEPTVSTS